MTSQVQLAIAGDLLCMLEDEAEPILILMLALHAVNRKRERVLLAIERVRAAALECIQAGEVA